ncbi:MAG: hypothetical protein NTV49_11290 [Kiritimatiellaeota bacterium]|nr:hypothetical protein [Kiritimatiellota bacterium]
MNQPIVRCAARGQCADALEVGVPEQAVEQPPALHRPALIEHGHAEVLHVERQGVAVQRQQQRGDEHQHAQRQGVPAHLQEFLHKYGPEPFHGFSAW